MTLPQLTILLILGAALGLFIWGRWRFDVVAMLTLLACIGTGLLPAGAAFDGFGHPAVVTVIAVLILTRALSLSGVIDRAAATLAAWTSSPALQTGLLTGLATALSAFMNNVGALALVMPVALAAARQFDYSPSRSLMPIAFGAILGGLITMIGTPPNLIISGYRRDLLGESFSMFDFAPVGLAVAIPGVLFLVLIGWRLVPERRGARAQVDLFEVADYVTELRVTARSPVVGTRVGELESRFTVLGLIRDDRRVIGDVDGMLIQPDDILLVQTDTAAIAGLTDKEGLELVGTKKNVAARLRDETHALVEAVVLPDGPLDGRTPAGIRLRSRFNINLLAVARYGKPFRQRLRSVRLRAGDVLLLQGETDAVASAIQELGCLPLAPRGLKILRGRAYLPLALFGAAILSIALGLLEPQVALIGAVVTLVLLEVLPLREVYDAVDWPVVVLLGAMIPVGQVLETTGATALIAGGLLDMTGGLPPHAILAILIVVTMTLSDVLNNSATAVIMAPIAIGISRQLGLDPDPFLMGVTVGASCAFLTPIGHQNNTLIMGPGGYSFGDYVRVGLPLEAVVLAAAVPVIPLVWPFLPAGP